MSSAERQEKLRIRLREGLRATHVEIVDDSARHKGHAGARGGAGHFNVVVVSPEFEGQDRVARHRAVYAAAGDMMGAEIHALSAQTYSPAEWAQRSAS